MSHTRDQASALLAAILADPADDRLRREYAELLCRHGDPRGELIRLHLDPVATPGAPRRSTRAIIEDNPGWVAPLIALGATEVYFDRGFPGHITMPVEAYLANAAALVQATPLTRLRLHGQLRGLGPRLAASPGLTHLTALHLRKTGLTDADLLALIDCGRLRALRELHIDENKITDAGIEALAASRDLPALVRVEMEFNPACSPIDARVYYDDVHTHLEPSPIGRELEAKYGPIAWLHPDD